MENIIHEVYFHTNDSPELEAFVKSYLGDMPLNSMYWHFGYMNKMTKGRVIYQKGSTDDFRKEIHSKTIMDKLKEIQYPNHEKVAYVLASHGIPNFDFNTCPKPAFNIPEPVYEIGRRTNGYLLYRRQAIQLPCKQGRLFLKKR